MEYFGCFFFDCGKSIHHHLLHGNGTNSNNCVNSNSFVLTVNPLPTVTANSNSTAICFWPIGNTQWRRGQYVHMECFCGNGNQQRGLCANRNGYLFGGRHQFGGPHKYQRGFVTVTVNALPTVSAAASSTVICNTQTVAVNGSGANTYTWTASVEVILLTALPLRLRLQANYSLVVPTPWRVVPAPTIRFVAVTVNTLPIVSASSSTADICIGSSVTLNGGGANTYTGRLRWEAPPTTCRSRLQQRLPTR